MCDRSSFRFSFLFAQFIHPLGRKATVASQTPNSVVVVVPAFNTEYEDDGSAPECAGMLGGGVIVTDYGKSCAIVGTEIIEDIQIVYQI